MSFSPALTQRLFPSKSLAREGLVVIAGAALIAALAQVRIDLWPVPVTGQTLGVLLAGGCLGFRRGTVASALYVAVGLFGAPVFAGPHAGVTVLTGYTGGYLVGFVFSAGTIGLLAEHGFLRTYARTALAMLIATTPVFVLGVAWLLNFLPARDAFWSGCVIFLPGAGIKIALATLLIGRSGRRVSGSRPGCA